MSKKKQSAKQPAKMTAKKTVSSRKNNVINHPLVFPWFEKVLEYRYTGAIIAGAYFLVMLALSFTYHKVGDYGVETDFFWGYVPDAKHFLDGIIKVGQFHGPLYPIVLGLVGSISGNFFKAGILIAVASAAIVLYFTYELLKYVFRADAAFLATLFTAFNPTFIQYSYSCGTDMFFAALVAGAAFLIIRQEKLRWWKLVVAALLAALAYLTRYNAIFFLVAVPVILLFFNLLKLSWSKRIIATAVFLGSFFVFITPWGIYSQKEKGSFFYNQNYLNIAYTFYEKGHVSWDQFWNQDAKKYHSLKDVITDNPGTFFSNITSNFFDHFGQDMGTLMGWYIGLFSLIGVLTVLVSFFYKREQRPSRAQLSFYFFNLMYYGVLLLVFYGARFSLYLVPFYSMLALVPFYAGEYALKNWAPNIRLAAIVAAILVVVSFYHGYKFNKTQISSGPQVVLKVSNWFHENVLPGKRGKIITARKPHIAYYMGLKFQRFPYVNNMKDLFKALKKDSVDYLYYGPWEASFRPALRFLLDPRKAPPQLTPMVEFMSKQAGVPVVLYKVNRDKLP